MFQDNNNAMYNNTATGEMRETMEGECTDNKTDESDITTSLSTLSSFST